MKRSHIVYLMLLLSNSILFAQRDSLSSYTSDVVEILDEVQSQEEIKFDEYRSINGMSFLSNLDRSTNLSVRSSGPGLLSTILRRGMASRHLALTWSGFNIQSVVNGTFDVGLIPQTFDKTQLISHDAHAAVGNASVAGAITLEHNLKPKSKSSVLMSYGSDQNTTLRTRHHFTRKKYTQSLGVELRDHKNRYGYKNANNRLVQDLADNTFADFNYRSQLKLSQKLHLNFGAWLQKSKRNIPPTKTSVDTNQYQEDENYRLSVGASYFVNEEDKIEWRSAYFKEILLFQAVGVDSRAEVDSYNAALDFLSNNGLTLSGQYRSDRVSATFFPEPRKRDNLSLLAQYAYSIGKWELSASVRPQLVDSDFYLGVSGLNAAFRLSDQSSFTAHLGQGFTLPSFNDLYWPSGGNPDLLTETSVNAELGYTYTSPEDRRVAKFTVFYNDIDNWIQWIPVSGRFQPVNQRKVRNLGFEVDYSNQLVINSKATLQYAISYAFTDSRLNKHYFDAQLEGRKTIFVPANKLAFNVSTKVGAWQFMTSTHFYSRRYDTVDNSKFVPGYVVVDAAISREWDFDDRLNLRSMISVENATNNNYENIRFYPMPLAVVRGGLQIHF